MKQAVRLLSLITALCMLVAGCASPFDQSEHSAEASDTMRSDPAAMADSVAMGRFVERDITPEPLVGMEQPQVIGFSEYDGEINLFVRDHTFGVAQSEIHHFRSAISGEWTEFAVDWADAVESDYAVNRGSIMDVVCDRQGTIYCILWVYNDGVESSYYLAKSEDGKSIEELPIDLGTRFSSVFFVTERGEIILGMTDDDSAGVEVYAEDGELLAAFRSSSFIPSALYADRKLYLYHSTPSPQLSIHNLDDFSLVGDLSVEPADEIYMTLAAGNGNAVHTVTQDGIKRYAVNGTLTETIVEGAATSFATGNIDWALYSEAAESFYVALYDNYTVSYRILAYQYDETVPTEPAIRLKVFSLYRNEDVRRAASMFMQRNPDIKVEYTVGLESEDEVWLSGLVARDPARRQEVLAALFESVLNETGPDIILFDNIPLDAYMDQDLLLPLDGIDGYSDLYQNIAAAYGGYAIPARFGMPLLYGVRELVEPVGDVEALVREMLAGETISIYGPIITDVKPDREGSPFLAVRTYGDAFQALYPFYRTQLLNGGEVDAGELKAFLQDLHAVSSKFGFEDSSGNYQVFDYYAMQLQGPNLGTAYRFNKSQAGLELISSVGQLQGLFQTRDASVPGYQNGYARAVDTPQFIPRTVVGINAGTTLRDEAVGFVECILSHEIQYYFDYNGGLPARRDTLENGLSTRLDKFNSSLDFDFSELVEQVVLYEPTEEVVIRIIYEVAELYSFGHIALADAVGLIRQEIVAVQKT